jgi:hypothetical protein
MYTNVNRPILHKANTFMYIHTVTKNFDLCLMFMMFSKLLA